MVKAFNIGDYVFSFATYSNEVPMLYVDASININFEYDHCPRVSLDLGIGKHMFEIGIHYQHHRTEYDERVNVRHEDEG